ncbi:MAG: peptidase MA family metallohydrolase [bacterium]|nr:peptidase MA family metallohydrolase [bacterium]
MVQRRLYLLQKAIVPGLALLWLCFSPATLASARPDISPRFILSLGSANQDLQTSSSMETFGSQALASLEEQAEQINRIFSAGPGISVRLRVLPAQDFTRITGAPSWTSAMFYNGEITIPFRGTRFDKRDLKQALRHEYVHAVTSHLSGNRCPAWLDEGLAQLLEGKPNSLLGPALRKWISKNNALSLDALNDGFMALNNNIVPTAYAHSLLVTRNLVNSHGLSTIRKYLGELAKGTSATKAFNRIYGKSQAEYEANLTSIIRRWAESENPSP